MTKIVINKGHGGFALSEQQMKACGLKDDGKPVDRTSPALVAMVEAGDKGFSDSHVHSNLVVVEIPDGAHYIIADNDGWETVYWSNDIIYSV